MDRLIPPVVLVVLGTAIWFAFAPENAGQASMLTWLLVPYLAFSALSFWRMYRDGTLLDLFRWRSGDVAFGALVAAVLFAGAFIGRQMIAPRGSAAEQWLMRIYLQLGEVPRDHGWHFAAIAASVIGIALMEEIVWRGLVQQILEEEWGVRRGWLVASALYALAHVGTVWRLAMPVGKNPLVVVAALFCGTVWGFFVGRRQRLPPMLVSHALFTYAIAIEVPLWRP